uniref:RNA helicase n=1 Tax=Plectus sambesii TaxID=2011161 RepID=A0A914WKY0_9BILA
MGLKRKLKESKPKKGKKDVAEAIDSVLKKEEDESVTAEASMTFSSFGLDDRLLKAIADVGWERPTLIQEQLIPLALEGKDIVARARTGSGKTAAFAVPIIQKILERKATSNVQCVRALIMTPTKELSTQVTSHMTSLCSACSMEVRVLDFSAVKDVKTQKALLADLPDVVVGTPSKLLPHMDALGKQVEFLVMDEADLLFSFGYEQDIRQIIASLPSTYQAVLTSATMTDDVKALKKLALHNAVTLKLEEAQLPGAAQLAQYHIRCEEEDKFVLIYALFKLRLIKGKTIVFVANTDRCYRLRLYLEQFGIPTCVLNSEMPVNSRCHIVHQFNEGRYDYMVASDVADMGGHELEEATDAADGAGKSKKKKRRKEDKESGVSRGIDFHRVSNVVNFDFPSTVDAYIHRVGRTARGWNKGTALSFATPKEGHLLDEVTRVLSEQMGGDIMKQYEFRMEELDGFRYRARDVMKAVTTSAVREARLAEIKAEVLRSKKLEGYFAQNPREQAALMHDKSLHSVNVHSVAIKDVPDYIG